MRKLLCGLMKVVLKSSIVSRFIVSVYLSGS